jgi:Ca2+-binding RTX toxin-like protein
MPENLSTLWGPAYRLPSSLQLGAVEAVARPGSGFTVFATAGSSSDEDYGSGQPKPYTQPLARMATFGNILDLSSVQNLIDDEGASPKTPDIMDFAVQRYGTGYFILATPGREQYRIFESNDFNTSIFTQTYGADGRSRAPAQGFENYGTQFPGTTDEFELNPRPGGWIGNWEAPSQDRRAFLGPGGALLAGPTAVGGHDSDIAVLPDEGFLATYLIHSPGTLEVTVYGRFYTAAGAAATAEFAISAASRNTGNPEAVRLAGGNVAVFWDKNGDVVGRLVSPAGTTVGGEFLVHGSSAGIQDSVKAIGLPDGGCLVFWDNYTSATTYTNPDGSIVAQRFDVDGQKVGGAFTVASRLMNRINGDGLLDVFSFEDGRVGVIFDGFGEGYQRSIQVVDTRSATLFGTAGADVIVGGAHNDTLFGGSGNDLLQGNYGTDRLYGDTGSDHLDGDDGNDWLFGGSSNDRLAGETGRDHLNGGSGNDFLSGGLGADFLTGGTGRDTFLFNNRPVLAYSDRVTDFRPVDDTIQLDNAAFRGLPNGMLAADAFHISTSSSLAADAEDRIIYQKTTGALFFDGNGDAPGGAAKFAQLAPGLSLSSADFVVI